MQKEKQAEIISKETRRKLFALIRAGLELPSQEISLTNDEYETMIKVCTQQSLLPIVYRGIKKVLVSDVSLDLCNQRRLRSEYQAIQHDDSIRRIRNVLDDEGIPYILLKGAVLRSLYPDYVLRTSTDIDILVHEEESDSIAHVLEKNTDFRIVKRNYHDISMISSRVHLELHFSIKEHNEKIDKVLALAWDYSKKTDDGSMYAFSSEYQLFHVVAHMSHHFLHGGLGIRPFIDLWLLRNRTQYSEEIVNELLSQCDLLQFYKECCKLSKVWLENEEHSETSLLFEEFCLAGGVFGSEKFRIAGTQRHKRGWRYVTSRVFPPKYQVKESYKDPSGKEHSLPYYYIKRWRCWLSKERRGELKRQVSETVKSDKTYQDSADELFKRLGFR